MEKDSGIVLKKIITSIVKAMLVNPKLKPIGVALKPCLKLLRPNRFFTQREYEIKGNSIPRTNFFYGGNPLFFTVKNDVKQLENKVGKLGIDLRNILDDDFFTDGLDECSISIYKNPLLKPNERQLTFIAPFINMDTSYMLEQGLFTDGEDYGDWDDEDVEEKIETFYALYSDLLKKLETNFRPYDKIAMSIAKGINEWMQDEGVGAIRPAKFPITVSGVKVDTDGIGVNYVLNFVVTLDYLNK